MYAAAFLAATVVESLVGLPSSVFASGVSGTSSSSEVPQAVSSVAVTAQMVNSDVLKVPNVSFFQVIIVSFVFCEPCPFRWACFRGLGIGPIAERRLLYHVPIYGWQPC